MYFLQQNGMCLLIYSVWMCCIIFTVFCAPKIFPNITVISPVWYTELSFIRWLVAWSFTDHIDGLSMEQI
jgi:hypothetical protein